MPRLTIHKQPLDNPIGYTLWLSANDTTRWAARPGAGWPCSQLRGKRLCVVADHSGIVDLTINGKSPDYLDSDELTACVADHLNPIASRFWPSYT